MDITDLKPGDRVAVKAHLRKVELGGEGSAPVVQLEIEQAEGFSLNRTTSVVVPLADVLGFVDRDEAIEVPAVELGGLDRQPAHIPASPLG